MVVYYDIFGQKVGSHILSLGMLTTMFVGGYMATAGGKKKEQQQGPPINAASKDEENFIQDFLKSADSPKSDTGSAKH